MTLRDMHYLYMRENSFTDEEIAEDWVVFEKDYQEFLDEHASLHDKDLKELEVKHGL